MTFFRQGLHAFAQVDILAALPAAGQDGNAHRADLAAGNDNKPLAPRPLPYQNAFFLQLPHCRPNRLVVDPQLARHLANSGQLPAPAASNQFLSEVQGKLLGSR